MGSVKKYRAEVFILNMGINKGIIYFTSRKGFLGNAESRKKKRKNKKNCRLKDLFVKKKKQRYTVTVLATLLLYRPKHENS